MNYEHGGCPQPEATLVFSLLLIGAVTGFFSLAAPVFAQVPRGIVYSVPLTITNSQPVATPAPFQQLVIVNSASYTPYETPNLQNVEFFDSSGSIIPSWLESGNSNTATNTIYWLGISGGIPAESSITVYEGFGSLSSNLLNSQTTGEAPQLSQSYGQYDDGSAVFSFYDNFAGASLGSTWSASASGGRIAVNNGLTIQGASGTFCGYGAVTEIDSQAPAVQLTGPKVLDASFQFSPGGTPNFRIGFRDTDLCDVQDGISGNGISAAFGGGGEISITATNPGPIHGGNGCNQNTPCTGNSVTTSSSPGFNTFSILATSSSAQYLLNYNPLGTITGNIPSYSASIGIGLEENYYPTTVNVAWVRVRSYPPNGVMPTASVGTSTTTTTSSTLPSSSLSCSNPAGCVITTIGVGTNPYGLAYDSSNGFVYVANFYANSVTVINGANDSVVGTVTTGNNPIYAAYDSSNGLIYVSNNGAGTVTVIDGHNNAVVDTIPVGNQPQGVAYDSSNGLVYVVDYGNNGVSVINGASNQVVGSIPVGNEPGLIAYDSGNGYVYVANQGSAVTVINGANETVVSTPEFGITPDGVAYDSSNGHVYVTDYRSGNVTAISGSQVIDTIALGVVQAGIAYDSGNGYLYVTDYNLDSVSAINGANDKVVGSIAVGANPLGVVYDSGNGLVYVTNDRLNTVSVISATASPTSQPTTTTTAPTTSISTSKSTVSMPSTTQTSSVPSQSTSLSTSAQSPIGSNILIYAAAAAAIVVVAVGAVVGLRRRGRGQAPIPPGEPVSKPPEAQSPEMAQKIARLKQMLDSGLITRTDYEEQKKKLRG